MRQCDPRRSICRVSETTARAWRPVLMVQTDCRAGCAWSGCGAQRMQCAPPREPRCPAATKGRRWRAVFSLHFAGALPSLALVQHDAAPGLPGAAIAVGRALGQPHARERLRRSGRAALPQSALASWRGGRCRRWQCTCRAAVGRRPGRYSQAVAERRTRSALHRWGPCVCLRLLPARRAAAALAADGVRAVCAPSGPACS